MTVSPTPAEAEKVVAEWRAAMEGVTPGPWRPSRFGFQVVSDYPEPAWQSVVELTTIARSEPNVEREMLTQQAIAAWIARCSPSGISALLALIESQRATIERVERERDEAVERLRVSRIEAECMRETAVANSRAVNAAEARVTALEAQKAGLREALEPFASTADFYRGRPDIDVVYITVGTLRRARAALSSTEVKNDG